MSSSDRTETTLEPILRVAGARVRYKNGATGISDVTINACPGQVTAIFGPNGAGKTSTLRAISGFMRAERVKVTGEITLGGQNITGLEPHEVMRRGLAFVPERTKVFARMTVRENLDMAARESSKARRRELMDGVLELFPALTGRMKEHAGRLSGGQQQMLAIARALISGASMLVIDEMTLGLHQDLHRPLFGVIKDIASSGTAVLVVDESTSAALEVADHCYLLRGGKVRMSGPPSLYVGNELLAAGYVED